MRNILLIRFLALILCIAMVCEITSIVEGVDLITAEADTEMEHEESKEKEKEKTTNGSESVLVLEQSDYSKVLLAMYHDRLWNTPFIDYQTPPPKLS